MKMTSLWALSFLILCLSLNTASSSPRYVPDSQVTGDEPDSGRYKPGYIPTEYEDDPVYDDTNEGYPHDKSGYIPTEPRHIPRKPGYTPPKPDYGDGPGYGSVHHGTDDGYTYRKSVPVPKCQTEMVFTFNNPKKPFQEIKNRIYAQGVGKVLVFDGAANFYGQGYIEIPYFNQNDLRPGYFLSIVIKPKGYGPPQTIFSNSFSTKYATLTLSLENFRAVLTIVERPVGKYGYGYRSEPVQLSVEINKGGYTRITIEQDDTTVVLSSDYDVAKTYSRLPAISHEPLYIGAGASAVKNLSAFKGSVDEFLFSKCPLYKAH